MLKKLWTSLTICLYLFAIPSIYAHGAQDTSPQVIQNDETGIPDTALYKSILETLGKKSNETFTAQEAATIEEFYPGSSKEDIKSLKGIGCLRGLTTLALDRHNISNLDGIEELTNLKVLKIDRTWIKSLKKLKNLKSLEFLDVSYTEIKSLAGIEGLSNLKTLLAGSNQLTNLKPLRELINLETLDVAVNHLTGLRELTKCKKIRYLNAGCNQLKSLSGIQNNKDMWSLSVSLNQLTDLKEISGMKKLYALEASYNRLKKLPNLKKVESISLINNLLDEKELKKKLPAKYFKDREYFKDYTRDMIEFQNLKCKASLTKPAAKKISKNTKTIKGKVSAPSKYTVLVWLTQLRASDDNDKIPYQPVKTDKNGNFTLKNLDLTNWAGKEVSVDLVLYNPKTKRTAYFPTDICFTVKK